MSLKGIPVNLSRRRMLQMTMALAPAALAAGQEPEREPDLRPTVSRVHPGPTGKLEYTADEQGNTIPDFSHAGYCGGGVPIPTVPTKETIWPVAGDNTANVQAAIDRVSALPADESGFRGAVLLKMGYYQMATPITIQASGVVLRGEGMSDTGTILIGTGNPRANAAGGQGGPGRGQPTLVRIAGKSGWTVKEETKQTVTDDYVPVGSRSIRVANTRGFKAGDTVIVRRIGNQAWIAAMGMNGTTPASTWKPFSVEWDRVVVDVHGDTMLIDVPITCAIEKRWGGGEIVKYDDPGRIEHVGVENLRGMSEFNPMVRTREYSNMDRPNYQGEEYYADEDHYWNFITLDNIRNALGAQLHGASLRIQHGGHAAGRQMDYHPGLRIARAGLTTHGRAAIYLWPAWRADAGAALPLRQGTSLLHDRPAYLDLERISGLHSDRPILIERDARAMGDR